MTVPPNNGPDPWQIEQRYRMLREEFRRGYSERLAEWLADDEESVERVQRGVDLVERAFRFAFEAHSTTKPRQDGSPYITHPIAVARIACQFMPDPNVIASCLLHDTVEDCETVTIERVEDEFGESVRHIVEGVTKLKSEQFTDKLSALVANLERLFDFAGSNFAVIVVKLSDRLHNTQTLAATPPEKQKRIASETRDIYVGVARRLGMYTVADEMDEITTKILEPDAWNTERQALDGLASQLGGAAETLRDELQQTLEEAGIRGHARLVRNSVSAARLLRLQQGAHVSEREHVFHFVLVVEQQPPFHYAIAQLYRRWSALPGFRDFFATPGANGERYVEVALLHSTLYRVKVRIWAPKDWERVGGGLTNYWDYRAGTLLEGHAETVRERFRRIQDSAASDPESASARVAYGSMRQELQQPQILVLTPSGERIELHPGDTALDFAFALSPDLGLRATGAVVNGHRVDLNTALLDGETVHILAGSEISAHAKWLGWARTGKAQNEIRRWFTDVLQPTLHSQARVRIDSEMEAFSSSLDEIYDDPKTRQRLEDAGWPTAEVLLAQVAAGLVDTRTISATVFPRRRARVTECTQTLEAVDPMVRASARLARCCSPLPGVEARAISLPGGRLVVHRADCVGLTMHVRTLGASMAYRWPETPQRQEGDATTRFTVFSEDVPRMIERLAHVFARENSNILKATCEARESGSAANLFEVSVRDQAHADRLLQHLRGVQGVLVARQERLLIP